jgi:hypothetical protein
VDEQQILDGLAELKRLNDNLEVLHRDAEDFKPIKSDLRAVLSEMKGMREGLVNVGRAAKQISILNQILLQIKKVSGWSGVFKSILDGLVRSVQSPPRKQ